MKQPLANGLLAIIIAVLAFVVVGLALLVGALLQDTRSSRAADAVLVISAQVAQLYQAGPAPTQAQIDDGIRELVRASVINAGLDTQQRPIDPYGTPFRVRHTTAGALHRVTATSAGPDRQFDTPDDISREATWETLPPEKR